MGLQFDGTGQFSLPTFMEFGIRHFRDWLHDDFAFAQKQGKKYLAIDPTLKSNMAKLSELNISQFGANLISVQKQATMAKCLRWSLHKTIAGGLESLT